MKKLLLAACVVLCSFALSAQSVYTDYQDGKIWFCVKNTAHINSMPGEDPRNLPLGTLPFLSNISKNHSVTKLSRPFFAAKNSDVLQRTYLLEFSDYASVMSIIAGLDATGKVEYAERVPLDQEALTPNDPSYGSQWHLATINAASAWNFFSTGSTIKIAIVDNAVDRAHQDLSGNLWTNTGEIASNGIDDDGNGYIDDINGYDVADNDNNPNPPNTTFDHGTHCAGIASAKSNNGVGIASIGYSCKLIAVKATANSASASSVTNGYDGVVYAVAAGADVISMSWGGTGTSTTAQNIITWASQQGAILVAAAGNSNTNTMFYPAAYTECIAVAATNSNDTKASFSNYGTWVDISAPGNNIYSTLPSNGYGNMSGTSMACPLVAGLCGLMLSLNPGLTPTDVRNCLTSSAVNINTINPSYTGQLGAGRIDANAAMTCISGTLSWPPNALFTANVTTVTAGGQVHFTDQSVYNPTSWNWSFPGGTPASYVGQTPPPIVYNTPGTYNVSLTVSNANGSDVQTNTNYITVNAAGGCLSVNYPIPSAWTLTNYYTGGPPVGAGGWINGENQYLDKQKAMYFDESSTPYTYLETAYIAFGLAYSATPAKVVPVRVYDGTSGTPGTLLGTYNLTMGQIMSDVSNGYYTSVNFPTPITLPVSKKFFMAVDLTNLQWQTGVHDTLSIVSNQTGQTTPSAVWEQQSDNNWYHYNTAGSWTLDISLVIHPFLTSQPSTATMTASSTTVCAGSQITFDATGSTYQDTLLWYCPGGTPTIANTVQNTVLYNTPGTYQAIVYVVGGGCSTLDSAYVNITVNPNPTLAVTTNPGTMPVCTGTPVQMTASGASTYIWSPATFLSATTGPSVTSTPTSSITYNLQGTGANGCSSNTTINVDVDNPPVAMVTVSDTAVCTGQAVVFDASGSTSATAFSWSFPGGNPASSSASSATVTYNTGGNYTATVVITNTCGTDSAVSAVVGVGCLGIDPVVQAEPSAFYNASMQQLDVQLPAQQDGYTLFLFNSLGQQITVMKSSNTHEVISTEGLSAGMYSLRIVDGNSQHTVKFVKN